MSDQITDFGWIATGTDDKEYGPLSKATLEKWIEQGVINKNTLLRHMTSAAPRPLADHGELQELLSSQEGLVAPTDKLAEVWPRKKRDQLALGAATMGCAWHKGKKAVGSCQCCAAPLCEKHLKRIKGGGMQPYCKRCQGKHYSRRAGAYILDTLVYYMPIYILFIVGVMLMQPQAVAEGAEPVNPFANWILILQLVGLALWMVRDSMFKGAGLGKRALKLRVVDVRSDSAPPSYVQSILRWLLLYVPLVNLIDLSIPYRDPRRRRYGDRIARTRVVETDSYLAAFRKKVHDKFAKKHGASYEIRGMTSQEIAVSAR